MTWTFYDYLGPSGRNAIRDWIENQPAGTRQRLKARLNTLVAELQNVLEPQFDRRHNVGQLRGPCAGLYELTLKIDRIQFRPIGVYGPEQHEFTLLAGAEERDGQLRPDGVCETAHERSGHIRERNRICLHRFD